MNFSDLGLCDELSQAVADLGYTSPTPIQEKAIPVVLMGRDILGSAQTGTGKTASFTLPMIEILAAGRAKSRLPRSLILAPTRELAAQVAESFEKFSTYHKLTMALLIGGVSFADQNAALAKGVDVLIATPGRLLDHFERGKVMLNDVKILVIDEADRMLDMGFIPDVERIVGLLPQIRQTLFFSATLSDDIHKISQKFVSNPKIIEVDAPASTADTVAQHILWTDPKGKRQALRGLLNAEDVKNAVIFCNRKRDIGTLVRSLSQHGYSAVALHGDMTQSARLEALKSFKAGDVPLLIASDVAARGLDIAGLSHVFNFDVPSSAEDYIHRIGRTGRAGASGRAFTIAASKDDKKYVDAIEKLTNKKIPLIEEGTKPAPAAKTTEAKPASQPSRRKGQQDKSQQDKSQQEKGQQNAAPKDDAASAETTASVKATPADGAKKASKSNERSKGGQNDNKARKDGGKPRSDRNRNRPDELPSPPDCSGNTLKDTGHVPAFLQR